MKIRISKMKDDGSCEDCGTRDNVDLVTLVAKNQRGEGSRMSVYLCVICQGKQEQLREGQ